VIKELGAPVSEGQQDEENEKAVRGKYLGMRGILRMVNIV